MICPKCKEEKEKRMMGNSVDMAVPPFYKDGKYHSGGFKIRRYGCPSGHRWWEIVPENIIGKRADKDTMFFKRDNLGIGSNAGVAQKEAKDSSE